MFSAFDSFQSVGGQTVGTRKRQCFWIIVPVSSSTLSKQRLMLEFALCIRFPLSHSLRIKFESLCSSINFEKLLSRWIHSLSNLVDLCASSTDSPVSHKSRTVTSCIMPRTPRRSLSNSNTNCRWVCGSQCCSAISFTHCFNHSIAN